ncbi:excalibur calcium-binding domain-containing protein [Streptomyces sp. NPDC090303]|uniref:excalibur calcium-binding domain-containing protein n=1 Tax=Streptomyces sp. NPDC090303 TaxID=3365960 RepID=UPI00382C23A0
MRDQSHTRHLSRGPRPLVAALATIAALALTACSGTEAPARSFDVTLYVHQGHVIDCEAFTSQADAQAVLRADMFDPNGLDRDGDGIACPKLPGPTDKTPVHRDFVTDKDGAPVAEQPAEPSPKKRP